MRLRRRHYLVTPPFHRQGWDSDTNDTLILSGQYLKKKNVTKQTKHTKNLLIWNDFRFRKVSYKEFLHTYHPVSPIMYLLNFHVSLLKDCIDSLLLIRFPDFVRVLSVFPLMSSVLLTSLFLLVCEFFMALIKVRGTGQVSCHDLWVFTEECTELFLGQYLPSDPLNELLSQEMVGPQRILCFTGHSRQVKLRDPWEAGESVSTRWGSPVFLPWSVKV